MIGESSAFSREFECIGIEVAMKKNTSMDSICIGESLKLTYKSVLHKLGAY